MNLIIARLPALVLFLGWWAPVASADAVRIAILHTNDLHDHVRAGENGLGGLPYVSGFVRQIRTEQPRVLLLDAGDVTEKGDLVAHKTQGMMTYEAMRRIRYDGVAVGNHDYDDVGVAGVRRYGQALGQDLLCLNIVRADGSTQFTASRIVDVGGIKVGLIGMIAPRKPEHGGLDFEASGEALAREAQRLRREVPLVIAVCHERVSKCAEWSRIAPDVQVFVSGHSHEAQAKPFVVPETGALIVQAGSYARWVGYLEIDLDPSTRKIIRHDGYLVPMRHEAIPVDAEMLAWVHEREQALAPEAATFVFNNPSELDRFSIARLTAEGLRRAVGAEIGFCHTYQVIRNILPAGRVDLNAIFKAGGQRGLENVLLELSGAEIVAYMDLLQLVQREPPEWAGFRASFEKRTHGGGGYVADLAAERRYRVVMPKIEWETRYLRLAAHVRERDSQHPLAARAPVPKPAPITFTDALHQYIRRVLAEGNTLQDRAARLAAEREALVEIR